MHQESKEEVWKDIPGFEGNYSVSNLGRVRSNFRTVPGKLIGIRRLVRERILKFRKRKMNGYLDVTIRANGIGKCLLVHRLVCETFYGLDPTQPYVNHKDGNKLNNALINLEWCTPAENNRHALDTGLRKQNGSQSSLSKLTEADIPVILELKKTMSYRQIGLLYGVYKTAIFKVCKGESWKHVTRLL
jgi:hypothetical protein